MFRLRHRDPNLESGEAILVLTQLLLWKKKGHVSLPEYPKK